jgi:uncharacterized protein DUF1844
MGADFMSTDTGKEFEDKSGAEDEHDHARYSATEFGQFMMVLASSALYQLGDAPGPDNKLIETPQLELAKQTISIISMLKEKTEGNRTTVEDQLINSLLFDLEMRFVKKTEHNRGATEDAARVAPEDQ